MTTPLGVILALAFLWSLPTMGCADEPPRGNEESSEQHADSAQWALSNASPSMELFATRVPANHQLTNNGPGAIRVKISTEKLTYPASLLQAGNSMLVGFDKKTTVQIELDSSTSPASGAFLVR